MMCELYYILRRHEYGVYYVVSRFKIAHERDMCLKALQKSAVMQSDYVGSDVPDDVPQKEK